MKIAHLTFHGSHNYGSVLQAYALSKQLTLMGHEVQILNLRPQSQREAYRIIRAGDRGIHRLFRYLIYPLLKKRFNHYERFINQVLPTTKKEYASTEELATANLQYDAYVCGGDQIWNPVCQDFETAYYLQFLRPGDKARRISYSPSLGKTDFQEETLAQMRKWVKSFDHISVREPRGAEIIQALTEKPVCSVCDPVLLLDKKYWEEMADKPHYKPPYILTYFLENNHGSRNLTDYLRKETGYEVVNLNEYIRDFVKPYKKAYDASPERFVGLFINAGLVYTNSFHGTAFATLFNKPLITAIAPNQATAQNNNDSRKIDYLNRLGLQQCLYSTGMPNLQRVMNMDYAEANQKLAQFRADSMQYLIHALQ